MCARGTPERCIRWPGHGTFLSQPSLALHSSALSLKFNYHRHGIFFPREMFSLSERDLWSPLWLRSLLLVPKVLKKDSLDMNEFIKARFWTRWKNPGLEFSVFTIQWFSFLIFVETFWSPVAANCQCCMQIRNTISLGLNFLHWIVLNILAAAIHAECDTLNKQLFWVNPRLNTGGCWHQFHKSIKAATKRVTPNNLKSAVDFQQTLASDKSSRHPPQLRTSANRSTPVPIDPKLYFHENHKSYKL